MARGDYFLLVNRKTKRLTARQFNPESTFVGCVLYDDWEVVEGPFPFSERLEVRRKWLESGFRKGGHIAPSQSSTAKPRVRQRTARFVTRHIAGDPNHHVEWSTDPDGVLRPTRAPADSTPITPRRK